MEREELMQMLHGAGLVGGARKNKGKKKLSKWNLYVKKHGGKGKSLKQLAREYKKGKKGGMVGYGDYECPPQGRGYGGMMDYNDARRGFPPIRPIRGGASAKWRTAEVKLNERAIALGKRVMKDLKASYPREYKIVLGSGITAGDFTRFSKAEDNKSTFGLALTKAWDDEIKANANKYYTTAEKMYLNIGKKALLGALASAKEVYTSGINPELVPADEENE